MAALVALTGSALADGVASRNTVGYQEIAISGYQIVTPTFKDMDEASYPIDKFFVSGATDGMTTIQVLDSSGQVTGMYYWYNAYQDLPAGWFDVTGLEPADISLAPGEAAFFYTEEAGVTVRAAGEVPGEITHSVVGYAMLGNGSPVEVAIDDVTIDGATDGMTTIQVLDSEGQVDGMYYWYNAYQGLPAGWFDVTGLEPAGITLQPGESLLFYSEEANVTMTVPGALD